MVDIKATFALPPPSLTMHHSIHGSHEEILPITLGVLSAAASEFEAQTEVEFT
jgi:hypothetical protein